MQSLSGPPIHHKEPGDLAELGEARGEKRKGQCFSPSSLGRGVTRKKRKMQTCCCTDWFLGALGGSVGVLPQLLPHVHC